MNNVSNMKKLGFLVLVKYIFTCQELEEKLRQLNQITQSSVAALARQWILA